MSRIEIKGVNLNYNDSAEVNPQMKDRPTVILMHGWGCRISTLASIERIFNPGMRVINIDLPGHGESSEPPEIWGVEEFTELLEEFVNYLEIKQPSLLGHSFGGRVAIIYASRNDVDKLVLVDSAGIKPDRSIFTLKGLKYQSKVIPFKAAKKLLPVILGKKKGNEIISAWRGKSGSADYRNSSDTMRGVMSRCVNQDLRGYMPDIKAPTLLIWGEKDTATPLSDAKKMEKLIPDAGLVVFPGCGHYSFLDDPVRFRSVLTVFFAKELGDGSKSQV